MAWKDRQRFHTLTLEKTALELVFLSFLYTVCVFVVVYFFIFSVICWTLVWILQSRQQKPSKTCEGKVKWVLCQGKNLFSNILTWKKKPQNRTQLVIIRIVQKSPLKKSEIGVNKGIIIITLLVFNRLLFPVIALLYLPCPVRCSWQQLCIHAFRCVSRPGRRHWQQLLSFSRDPSAPFT